MPFSSLVIYYYGSGHFERIHKRRLTKYLDFVNYKTIMYNKSKYFVMMYKAKNTHLDTTLFLHVLFFKTYSKRSNNSKILSNHSSLIYYTCMMAKLLYWHSALEFRFWCSCHSKKIHRYNNWRAQISVLVSYIHSCNATTSILGRIIYKTKYFSLVARH